ncbi:phosphatase PAP2 family protein [Seonamhaeicola sp. ML3]|uniref:phosphatase PAP2 family protein n=1 Tax=Seonamhaeicola sp. ML3 TaxID=2937786 RepID=UPI00200C701B|nr:phosphatase PAP2 family protein [Seonamhaeicola sp. ML3]
MNIGLSFGQQVKTKGKDSIQVGALFKHDIKSIIKSTGHAFSRPVHWKGNDFIKLGGLLGGTIALSAADDEINSFFSRQREDFPSLVRDIGWYMGSPQNYFMANAGLYGFGLLTKNEQIRRTSVLIISSTITTGVITSLLKTGVGRARPDMGLGNWGFEPFSSEGGFHSFPSGHSSLSITMAHAIAKQFDNTWVKIGIYSIGAIPPVSRLVDNAHWITDIAFSTALSIIVVDSIDKFLSKKELYSDRPTKPNKISWNISFSTNKIGFTGTF